MIFHDIFSKSKRQKEKPELNQNLKIIIDIREKNSLVPSALSRLNINTEFKHLEVADYIINDIAIERKTINDFKSSILNRRILSQLENMKKYQKRLLVLEGFDINGSYEGIIHENAMRGFILSTLLNHQTPIIFTRDEYDTAAYLLTLAKKQLKRPSETSLLQKRKAKSNQEQKQFVLESFPKIGPTTAKKLLSHFKTLKNIINASEEELKKVLGKKSDIFIDLLG